MGPEGETGNISIGEDHPFVERNMSQDDGEKSSESESEPFVFAVTVLLSFANVATAVIAGTSDGKVNASSTIIHFTCTVSSPSQ